MPLLPKHHAHSRKDAASEAYYGIWRAHPLSMDTQTSSVRLCDMRRSWRDGSGRNAHDTRLFWIAQLSTPSLSRGRQIRQLANVLCRLLSWRTYWRLGLIAGRQHTTMLTWLTTTLRGSSLESNDAEQQTIDVFTISYIWLCSSTKIVPEQN